MSPTRSRSTAVRYVSVLILALATAQSRADSAEAMRWIDTGQCERAGAAINEGLDRNEAKAYLLAGYLYASTGCVAEDLKRAARYYQRAVELGDRQARLFLGFMYGMGHGVPQDYREAYRWYAYESTPDARAAKPREASDAASEIAYGYASTVTQLARSKVRYPPFTDSEGTVLVTFHSAGGPVTFSTEEGPGRRLVRPSKFTNAIADAYAEAVQWAPKAIGLPVRDVAFEVPWTFGLK